MSKARERKREQTGQKGTWLTLTLNLLRGGILGFAVSCGVLGIAAFLICSGVMGYGKIDSAAVAACLLGGFTGGIFVVKRVKRAPLPLGIGAGGVLYLMLLAMGSLLYNVAPELSLTGVTAGACLCGGGLSGFAGGTRKNKKHK